MRLDSLIGRLQDLLDEGISSKVKIGYKYNDKIKYIAPVSSCENESELVYFSAGMHELEELKEDNLDNFLDNIISSCNRCSHGDTDCEKYNCSLKITPLVNCCINDNIEPTYDVETIEYSKNKDMIILELSK